MPRASPGQLAAGVSRPAHPHLCPAAHPVPRPALPACPVRLRSIPDAALAKQLGLNEALLQSVMQLPGTQNMVDLKTRLVSLADWNNSLRK